ncbi:hypothetical protein BTJ40_05600 [Microbulbifer sp. A4B17]|nr:hypothetical protein BTJ40_05600 [Microbulbifer sp. A4B17]
MDHISLLFRKGDVINIQIDLVFINNAIFKIHPDTTGALKNDPQVTGRSRGGWTAKIHMIAADDKSTVIFSLSAGQYTIHPNSVIC